MGRSDIGRMTLKILSVTIRIGNPSDDSVAVTTISRLSAESGWTIEGPLYPRHATMLARIAAAIKEADLS